MFYKTDNLPFCEDLNKKNDCQKETHCFRIGTGGTGTVDCYGLDGNKINNENCDPDIKPKFCSFQKVNGQCLVGDYPLNNISLSQDDGLGGQIMNPDEDKVQGWYDIVDLELQKRPTNESFLLKNTPKTLTNNDTSAFCEQYCEDGYTVINNKCEKDTGNYPRIIQDFDNNEYHIDCKNFSGPVKVQSEKQTCQHIGVKDRKSRIDGGYSGTSNLDEQYVKCVTSDTKEQSFSCSPGKKIQLGKRATIISTIYDNSELKSDIFRLMNAAPGMMLWDYYQVEQDYFSILK